DEDVQAFYTGGEFGDKMVIVAVWSGESDPEVAQYGGARQLLELFLMTMEVCPAHPELQPAGVCPQAAPTPIIP
ncbi:MAG TPA: hypothetical protein VFJ00_04835, partial [Candidatus Limnocylindria bacterium]|nr:hypothetical protein [Candidatus Limnocylindria bacterium]